MIVNHDCGIILWKEKAVIKRVSDGAQGGFYMGEIKNHSLFVRFSFDVSMNGIGMAMKHPTLVMAWKEMS